jgi:hypothetical protein
MNRYYVTAFGMYFCMVRGWVWDVDSVRPVHRCVADIVKEVQPGVVLVEVSV